MDWRRLGIVEWNELDTTRHVWLELRTQGETTLMTSFRSLFLSRPFCGFGTVRLRDRGTRTLAVAWERIQGTGTLHQVGATRLGWIYPCISDFICFVFCFLFFYASGSGCLGIWVSVWQWVDACQLVVCSAALAEPFPSLFFKAGGEGKVSLGG